MIGPFLLLLALAAPGTSHRLVRLDCPESIQYIVVRDLDRDGLQEILVLGGHSVWWWHGRRGAWPAEPDARLELPAGTSMFDVGPPEAARQSLVVRAAETYESLAPGRKPVQLGFRPAPGLPRAPSNVLWRGLFRDFDGDGRSELIDVSMRGYRIHYADGTQVELPGFVTATADTRTDAVSDRMVVRWAIGDWSDGDFDGDGNTDFAIVTQRGLRVHPAHVRGRFEATRAFDVPLEEAADADLRFPDLNGDGRTDVLALRARDGRAIVLVADHDAGMRRPHRIRLAMPGELRSPRLADFDGDGRPDLALPYTTRPSVKDAVRVLMRGEFLLKVPIFLNRGGERPFARLADRQLTLPLKIRVGTDSAGRIRLSGLVVVEHGGDLDGDGRPDLLVSLEPDLLAVHRGVPERLFEDEPAAEIEVPDSSAYDSVWSSAGNLDGDARSDVVLHYRGAGRLPDAVHLLLSGKE